MSQNKSKVVNKYDTPELPEFNELFNAMLEDFGNDRPSHRIKMLESFRPICNYFFNMGISQNLEHGLKTELQTISDTQQQILELVQNALLDFVGELDFVGDDDDCEPAHGLTQQQILELVQNALLDFVGELDFVGDDDDCEPAHGLTLDSTVSAAAETQVL